ncbi:MAG: Gfo/Idh/MocA family oxidoreductase, partial [Marmoricola sp.]
MNAVRWAVAGYGAGGRVFHAPLVRSAAGIDLFAVVSTNPSRASEAEADGLTAVASLDGLASLGVEGVTVTTPPGTHVDLAHRALDAGLHVVVDKPFALDAASARSVVEHAERAGRVLSVYQNRRWDGDFLSLRALVDSGELGTVRRLTTRVERFRPELPAWLVRAPASEGGGTLVDLGPHLIDQATQLFGP